IEDVHTGNLLLKDNGRVVPIDVHVRFPEGSTSAALFHSPEIPLTEAVKQVPPEHRPAIRAAARRISQVKKENPEAVPLSVVRDRNTGLPKIDVVKDADGEPILAEKGNPELGVVFAGEPYNLRKAPGLSTDDGTAVQPAAEKMVPDVKEALKNPEIAAGVGWYSKMRRQLQKAFGADIELFGQLLGATSARTPVVENFNQTLDAIRQLSKGAYDDLLERYHE